MKTAVTPEDEIFTARDPGDALALCKEKLIDVAFLDINELGLSDVFRHRRDSYAIVPDKIPCDYYRALARDVQALSGYQGEYMSQYEWAAYRHLTNKDKLLSQE